MFTYKLKSDGGVVRSDGWTFYEGHRFWDDYAEQLEGGYIPDPEFAAAKLLAARKAMRMEDLERSALIMKGRRERLVDPETVAIEAAFAEIEGCATEDEVDSKYNDAKGVLFQLGGLEGIIKAGMERSVITNGGMRVRIAGSGPPDPWTRLENTSGSLSTERSTFSPPGFGYSFWIKCTAAAASIGSTQFASVRYKIEGYEIADFKLGTPDAVTFTVSFLAWSSLVGKYAFIVRGGTPTRAYICALTINEANVWEPKVFTIVGDKTGTWNIDNTTGWEVILSFASGTSYRGDGGIWEVANRIGITDQVNFMSSANDRDFYFTGIRIEEGTIAHRFEHLPYAMDLNSCERLVALAL